jgi:hypothetical protein
LRARHSSSESVLMLRLDETEVARCVISSVSVETNGSAKTMLGESLLQDAKGGRRCRVWSALHAMTISPRDRAGKLRGSQARGDSRLPSGAHAPRCVLHRPLPVDRSPGLALGQEALLYNLPPVLTVIEFCDAGTSLFRGGQRANAPAPSPPPLFSWTLCPAQHLAGSPISRSLRVP